MGKRKSKPIIRQNVLLQKSVPITASGGGVFVEDIDHDEMRSGFLVTSQRKKLWNAEINLINEFARICKKHNLRWFADGGTLLGAARHKGFIPWDDDVDVVMLRPDYDKFCKIVAAEINPPYFVDIWYNYRLEDDAPYNKTDLSLPLISTEHHRKEPLSSPFFPLIKIKDKRTTFVEFPEEKHIPQNIFIDIFPFDSLPPFRKEQQNLNFEIARLLFVATVHPQLIIEAMQNRQELIFDYDSWREFIKLPYQQRGMYFEEFLIKNFSPSECVGSIRDWCIVQKFSSYKLKDFKGVTYLPFEKIEVPAPIGYESILTDYYGDWRKLVYTHSHAKDYSVDISYDDYLRKSATLAPIMKDDRIVGLEVNIPDNA